MALKGWVNVGLLAATLVGAPFDSRPVTGLNPRTKPINFTVYNISTPSTPRGLT